MASQVWDEDPLLQKATRSSLQSGSCGCSCHVYSGPSAGAGIEAMEQTSWRQGREDKSSRPELTDLDLDVVCGGEDRAQHSRLLCSPNCC
jgi:hypothetical protein